MSGSVRVALCFALACVPGISTEPSCPSALGTKAYVHGQSCYEFVTVQDTWLKSRTYCRAKGGRLATINTAELQQWASTQAATLFSAGQGVWLGLNDREKSSTFVWDNYNNATELAGTYYNWQLREPRGFAFLGQHCVYMDPSEEWRWAVTMCGFPVYGLSICEYALLTQTSPKAQLSSVNSSTVTARSVVTSVMQTSQPSLTTFISKLLSSTSRSAQGSQTISANYVSALLSSKSVPLTTSIHGLLTSFTIATKPLASTVSTTERPPTSTHYGTSTMTSQSLLKDTSTWLTSPVAAVGRGSESSVKLSATTNDWLEQKTSTNARETALASTPSSSVKAGVTDGNVSAMGFRTSSSYSPLLSPAASTTSKEDLLPATTSAGMLSGASDTTKNSADSLKGDTEQTISGAITVSTSSSIPASTLKKTTKAKSKSSSPVETTPQATKWTAAEEVDGTSRRSSDYSIGNASPTVSVIRTAKIDADAAQAKPATDRTHNVGFDSALALADASAVTSDGKKLAMTMLPVYLPIVAVAVVAAIVTTAVVLHQKRKHRHRAAVGLQNPMFDFGMPVAATFAEPATSSTYALINASKVT